MNEIMKNKTIATKAFEDLAGAINKVNKKFNCKIVCMPTEIKVNEESFLSKDFINNENEITMSEKITIKEIIGFFEKDIKASEKIKEELRKIKFTPVKLCPEQIEMIGRIKEEQVLRYVISKLKQFNNQK